MKPEQILGAVLVIQRWYRRHRCRKAWIKRGFSQLILWSLIGPPGAGKRTLMTHLSKEFSMVPLSFDNLIDTEHREALELCNKRKSFVAARRLRKAEELWELHRSHELPPLEWVVDLFVNAIFKMSGKTAFILEDFPQTLGQATLFEKRLCCPKLIIKLSCDPIVAFDRLRLNQHEEDEVCRMRVARQYQRFEDDRVWEGYNAETVFIINTSFILFNEVHDKAHKIAQAWVKKNTIDGVLSADTKMRRRQSIALLAPQLTGSIFKVSAFSEDPFLAPFCLVPVFP